MMTKTAIYVHIPFCKKRCSYCAFLSSCDFSAEEQYVKRLCQEMTQYAKEYHGKTVDTIYLGGGTPSSVKTNHIDKIFDTISKHFKIDKNPEITVECNPESVNDNFAQCLQTNGVNRVSLGLQSTNDDTLKRIGRLHSFDDFLRSLNIFNSVGISNMNADLIIGLPESFDSFKTSVMRLLQLPVCHISMYALELHEGTKLFDDVKHGKEKTIYDDDTLCDWYDEAKDMLENQGFFRYEVSNFSKDGFASRHNMHYWKCHDYFGFGAGAHGFLDGKRYQNQNSVETYINCGKSVLNSQKLSQDDMMYEFVMLGLRLADGVDIAEFQCRFGVNFFETFPKACKLIANGFLKQKGNSVFVSSDRFYVLNSILNEILP